MHMRHRLRHLIPTIGLFATALTGQCFESNFGTLVGSGDEGLFAPIPMNISFPMGGAFANYTHVTISLNGVLNLWNNGGPAPDALTIATTSASFQLSQFRGNVGGCPRIAPLFRDLNFVPSLGGGVWCNTAIPGKCVVTWANAIEFGVAGATPFTFQVQLLANGQIRFYYDRNAQLTALTLTGISQGGGITAPPGSDISAGSSSATRILYEQFAANTFDLQERTVTFTPTLGGYNQTVGSCTPAYHESYGAGCYRIGSSSVYQLLPNAAAAAPALTGNSMRFVPAPGGFTAQWGGGVFQTPDASAALVFFNPTDDGVSVVTPSQPFPSPSGPQATLSVSSNAIVSWGPNPQTFPNGNDFTPAAVNFLNADFDAIWAWHDYNEAEAGSGRILRHETIVGGHTLFCITWLDVENYSSPLAVNRSTMQMQFDLTSGDVAIVWSSIDGNSTSVFGSAHLIGYSQPGPSIDPGSIVLATALPRTVSPDVQLMQMSAAPTPISTASSGRLVTYTHTNVPEFAPGSGLFVGGTVLSFGADVPGLDLTAVGMPGCRLHLASMDDTLVFFGPQSTLTSQFQVPAGVPPGIAFHAQAAALIPPNSLPNGQNPLGIVLSNAIRSIVQPY